MEMTGSGMIVLLVGGTLGNRELMFAREEKDVIDLILPVAFRKFGDSAIEVMEHPPMIHLVEGSLKEQKHPWPWRKLSIRDKFKEKPIRQGRSFLKKFLVPVRM